MGRRKLLLIAPTMRSAPTGPIALGNIIKDPRSPEIPLTDIHSNAVKQLADKYWEVRETNNVNHGFRTGSSNVGVVAKFFESLAGFGLDMGTNHERSAQFSLKIDRLITRSISPSMKDVSNVFNEPSVQDGIRSSLFGNNVFMITSVQVAYGADDFISTLREHGAHLHASADLKSTLLPINVGASGSSGATDGTVQKSTIDPSTPFVLAYRLREIHYRRKRVRGQKEYENGDLYSVGGSDQQPVADEDDAKDSVAEFIVLDDENSDLAELWELEPNQYILEGSDEENDDSDEDLED